MHRYAIDTIDDYDALRSYEGLADKVYVQDFTYTFNSVSYTTIGGIFILVSTGTENGGTLIRGAGTRRWKRDFSGGYRPEWWVVGGYSPEATIGNVCTNERDRLEAASQIASNNGEIWLIGGKTYEIDRRVFCRTNQRWTAIGGKAIFKRVDQITSTLTAGVTAGTNTVTVTDATGFRIGQTIALASGNAASQSSLGSGATTITAIASNTLTTDNNFLTAFNIGDSAVVIVDLLQNVSFGDPQNMIIENIIFEGNSVNNTITNDWRANRSLTLGQSTSKCQVRDCFFRNTPSENIIGAKAIVQNCVYDQLGGSFYHNSNSAVVTDDYILFTNISGNGSCLLTQAITGHSEATIVYSSNVSNVLIENCNFENGSEAIVASLGIDSSGFLKIVDSFFKDYSTCIIGNTSSNASNINNFHVSNSTFENCGSISLRGQLTTGTSRTSNFNFINNTFVNSTILFRDLYKVTFDNNIVSTTDGFTYTGPIFNNAAVHFRSVNELICSKNRIIGSKTYDSNVQHGLLVSPRLSAGVLTNTNLSHTNAVKISDNIISNYRYGLSGTDDGFFTTWTRGALDWTIYNNNIYVIEDSAAGAGWGMYVAPGVYAFHNTIVCNRNTSTVSPIFVAGMNTGHETQIRGGNCQFNTVIGTNPVAIQVCSTAAGRSEHNAYVANNLVYGDGTTTGQIQDNSNGNSTIGTNTTLPLLSGELTIFEVNAV